MWTDFDSNLPYSTVTCPTVAISVVSFSLAFFDHLFTIFSRTLGPGEGGWFTRRSGGIPDRSSIGEVVDTVCIPLDQEGEVAKDGMDK